MKKRKKSKSNHLQVNTTRTVLWKDETSQNWRGSPKKQQQSFATLNLSWIEEGLIHAKGRIGKSQLGLNVKLPIFLNWKHHAVELFLQNEQKNNHHERTEHFRKIFPQKMWILGIRSALRSIKNKCVTYRKGRAQTKAPVMADLPGEWLDASAALTNVGVHYLGLSLWKLSEETKTTVLFVHITNSESGAHRSGTQFKYK